MKVKRVIEAKATKVREIVGYPMYSVATLQGGRKIVLDSFYYDNFRYDSEIPEEGGYFIEEGHSTFFLSEKTFNDRYQKV